MACSIKSRPSRFAAAQQAGLDVICARPSERTCGRNEEVAPQSNKEVLLVLTLHVRFWQARYAAFLIPSSPSFPHSLLHLRGGCGLVLPDLVSACDRCLYSSGDQHDRAVPIPW